MKVRVFEKPNGQLIIMTPVIANRAKGETEKKHLNRCTKKAGYKYPYYDFDSTALPSDSSQSGKWRLSLNKKSIIVDTNLETKDEICDITEKDLDSELAKTKPDPIKVIKLHRNIEKLKRETWTVREKNTKKVIE